MPRVVFTPSGLDGEVVEGTTVLEAARQLGVDLDTVCGGRGICGRCQVTPSVGTFDKWSISSTVAALTAPGPTENEYRGKRPLRDGQRLGCSTGICGDVVLDVPPESQIHKQVVRKEVNIEGIQLDPTIELRYVELVMPELGEDATAADLIVTALAKEWDIEGAVVAPQVLPTIHAAVESDEPGATVALRRSDSTVVAAWAGFVDTIVGVAVDIGSTTVAGHLCNLATGEVLATSGRMNPQIRFGEDLMSRVSYVMMNPGGDVELTTAIRSTLDELVTDLLDQTNLGGASVSRDSITRDKVLSITLVGNPVMHHILLGVDPTPLGAAPFLLAISDAVQMRATELDLSCPNASVYIAPCIAGHVGADTAAAVLSEGPHRSDEVQLMVDVGTNAEIVLGNNKRLFAASSPTGPAFEGAQLSCGVRASAGAIERVRIDRETLEPRIKIIGTDLWSDEEGFDEAAKKLGVIGVCGSGIIEAVAELFLAQVLDEDGVVRSEGAERTERVIPDGRTFSYVLWGEHRITQNDVRAIQLAKAALRAGIDLLMEHAELNHVDDVRLAGAFGSHIDPVYAMVLGLIPDCEPSSVSSSGNSAGTGAVRMLLSGSERSEIENVVRSIHKIETATEPRFQELFVNAMAFPHKTTPTPHLAKVIDLPAPMEKTNNEAGGRRRRRRPAS